ncbi:MAG: DUF6186 family protein [Acidimicrobiia bacterium]
MTARWVTLTGWIVLAAAVIALDLRARLSRGPLATLGGALSTALRVPAVRGLTLAGWLWLGWHLFVR